MIFLYGPGGHLGPIVRSAQRSDSLLASVCDLGMGIGIAQGYATIGAIGFEGRLDYGAIGTVTNLAARLCGEANSTDILISQRVAGRVEDFVSLEPVGPLALKGFARPVPASVYSI